MPLPLNDALNKPKKKFGIDYRLALASLGAGVVVMLFVSTVGGIGLMILLPSALALFFRKDPAVWRLWQISMWQRAYYDPGKEIQ